LAERELRLRDGRRLAYEEYGAADGQPVFFFHGWPGSRLDFAPNDAAAAAAGVRVIAVDRPGIGGSDHQPGRRVLDWPKDVAALADALAVERFAVLGFSFGGPYARACAYALPDRVIRCGLVSCLAPIDDPDAKRGMPPATRYGLAAARLSPWLARPMVAFTARQARGGTMVDQLAKSMTPADAEVLKTAGRPQRARGQPRRVLPPGPRTRDLGRRCRRTRRGLQARGHPDRGADLAWRARPQRPGRDGARPRAATPDGRGHLLPGRRPPDLLQPHRRGPAAAQPV
jgi:pimeloyl-ACP methyl ester carboxylesterase